MLPRDGYRYINAPRRVPVLYGPQAGTGTIQPRDGYLYNLAPRRVPVQFNYFMLFWLKLIVLFTKILSFTLERTTYFNQGARAGAGSGGKNIRAPAPQPWSFLGMCQTDIPPFFDIQFPAGYWICFSGYPSETAIRLQANAYAVEADNSPAMRNESLSCAVAKLGGGGGMQFFFNLNNI